MTGICLAIIMVFTACQPNRIFEAHQSTATYLKWPKSEVIKFEVDVERTDVPYTITVAVRYAQGYPDADLKLNIQHISPSDQGQVISAAVPIRDSEGGYLGDGAGDIWDTEKVVSQGFQFQEKGRHTFNLVHEMQRDPALMIMEVGLAIDAEVDSEEH